MIKFICVERCCTPDGFGMGEEHVTFTEVDFMEMWLREKGTYRNRSLVGIELIDKEEE